MTRLIKDRRSVILASVRCCKTWPAPVQLCSSLSPVLCSRSLVGFDLDARRARQPVRLANQRDVRSSIRKSHSETSALWRQIELEQGFHSFTRFQQFSSLPGFRCIAKLQEEKSHCEDFRLKCKSNVQRKHNNISRTRLFLQLLFLVFLRCFPQIYGIIKWQHIAAPGWSLSLYAILLNVNAVPRVNLIRNWCSLLFDSP